MAEPVDTPRRAVRAAIVYRHALLRDIVIRVLTNAGVDVVGTISVDQLASFDLDELRADVVVVDRAVGGAVSGMCDEWLLSRRAGQAGTVVSIDLNDDTMVISSRRCIEHATTENLVDAVVGAPTVVTSG